MFLMNAGLPDIVPSAQQRQEFRTGFLVPFVGRVVITAGMIIQFIGMKRILRMVRYSIFFLSITVYIVMVIGVGKNIVVVKGIYIIIGIRSKPSCGSVHQPLRQLPGQLSTIYRTLWRGYTRTNICPMR